MARVLAVGGEAELVRLLEDPLRRAGHELDVCVTGAAVLERCKSWRPDVLLLDQNTEWSTAELLRTLRREPATAGLPVLVMATSADEIERVVAFELGADDFVDKPFSVRELTLRIGAILRRRRSTPPPPIAMGRLLLDVDAHRVTVEGREVPLSALEFKLLRLLYERRERIQSRSILLDQVWGRDEEVSARTVDACVKRLRQKLGAAGDAIETVRGVGYRFNG